jgi:threonine dehydrogenase-like Zn-dependent dehydrogenase
MDAPGDVRVEECEDPKIIEPTDAIIRITATCICGSQLWPYRGVEYVDHQPMGHEYVGAYRLFAIRSRRAGRRTTRGEVERQCDTGEVGQHPDHLGMGQRGLGADALRRGAGDGAADKHGV